MAKETYRPPKKKNLKELYLIDCIVKQLRYGCTKKEEKRKKITKVD